MIHPYQVNEGIEKKMVTDHKVLVKNLSKQYALFEDLNILSTYNLYIRLPV